MTFALPTGLLVGGRFADWAPSRPEYLVADVDGTLVGPAATASDGVVAAVARARATGLTVGFATGRMRLAVVALHDQLGLPGPHVLHNGAEVRAAGATVAAWPLDDAGLDEVFRLSRELDAYAEIYTADGYHVTAMDDRARPHWDLLGHDPLSVVSAVGDLGGQPVLKATFVLFGTDPGPVVDGLTRAGLRAGPAGSPLTPGLTYVNATHPDAHKGNAVRRAAEHLGVTLSATVAVGDADNDLPMLEVAGTAIAMGQASDTVKAAAHLVVPQVDDDGVAHAIDACIAWRRGEG